jgi:hypothetical protein
MKAICSLILSASLLSPGTVVGQGQSPQQKADGPPVQQAQAAPPAVKEPLAFGLEDGTPVKLRINRTISSADAHVNDTVDFEVLEEVKFHDVIIVPRGSMAWGTVTDAQPKRRMGRGGKLDVNIDDVRIASGEKVPLRAVKDAKGGGHVGAMTGAIVATAIVFFPAAPLFLFMHGKDISIPKGTEITAYINGDVPLEAARFAPAAVAAPLTDATLTEQPAASVEASTQVSSQTSPQSTETTLSKIDVKSDPVGAEITVDEKYMGSTPSDLRLSAGDHKVKLEKSGFKPWEKTLTVTSGASATVDATLEKN